MSGQSSLKFKILYDTKEAIIDFLRHSFALTDIETYRNILLIQDRFAYDLRNFPAIIVKSGSYPLNRTGLGEDFLYDKRTIRGEVILLSQSSGSFTNIYITEGSLLTCVLWPQIFDLEVVSPTSISISTRHRWEVSEIMTAYRNSYRIKPRASMPVSTSTIDVVPGMTIKNLIHNVEIQLSDTLIVGDKVTLLLLPIGEAVSKIKGGIVDINVSLNIIAESTTEAEELADLCSMFIWSKKEELDTQNNILVRNINGTGESEVAHYNDFLYMTGLDLALRTHWTWETPYSLYVREINYEQIVTPVNAIQTICHDIPVSILD